MKQTRPKIGEIWKYEWDYADEYREYGIPDSPYKHYIVLAHIGNDDYNVYNIECGIEEIMSWEDYFINSWEKISDAPNR
jgi:hypothetical protein